MGGLGGLAVCSFITITDHAGSPGSMNFQFQPHLAASCVLPSVLGWSLFGLLYPFPPYVWPTTAQRLLRQRRLCSCCRCFGVRCPWLALSPCVSLFCLNLAAGGSAHTCCPVALAPPCEEAACHPYPAVLCQRGRAQGGGPGAERVSLEVPVSHPSPSSAHPVPCSLCRCGTPRR